MRPEGYPDERFDYFGALSQLASDVISNPASAAAFVKDPSGYFTEAGFTNFQVDPQSREFKLALALADPRVRAAAISGDPILFLDTIRPLEFDTSDLQILSTRPDALIVVVAVAVLVVIAIAVAVAVAVVVVVEVAVAEALVQSSEAAQLAAALGGKSFAVDVVKAVARNRADAVIRGIENGQISLPPTVSK